MQVAARSDAREGVRLASEPSGVVKRHGPVTSQDHRAHRHTPDNFCSTMLVLLLYVCSRTGVSFVVLVLVAVQIALLQRVGPTSATVHWP